MDGMGQGELCPVSNMDPEQLINYQRENKNYEILDLIQNFILELEGASKYQGNLLCGSKIFFPP